MNRKETLRALLNPQAGARSAEPPATEAPENASGTPSQEVSEQPRRTGSGAVRSMGLTLQKLSAEAENARALRAQLAQGASVVELDPELIEPSFISDRFSRDEDELFMALIESIRTHGQQVPVLLRPCPGKPGRYQVAYGHRRIQAASRLGQKVRAMIRDLSDVELVIAQGKENSERKDLSFIERAVFARHLEERGFDRATIIAALAVDKAEVARFLSVAHSVPAELVLAIGPAPKAGRPRWLALARLLSATPSKEKIVDQYLDDPALKQMDTDGRFIRLFTLLSSRNRLGRTTPSVWRDSGGRPIVRIEPGARKTTLTIDEKLAPAFGAFITSKLDDLYRAFGEQSGCNDAE